jgi:hypothetical protein
MEETSKVCGHIWCVVLCLSLGYLTVFGGRDENMENKTFPRSSLYDSLCLGTLLCITYYVFRVSLLENYIYKLTVNGDQFKDAVI